MREKIVHFISICVNISCQSKQTTVERRFLLRISKYLLSKFSIWGLLRGSAQLLTRGMFVAMYVCSKINDSVSFPSCLPIYHCSGFTMRNCLSRRKHSQAGHTTRVRDALRCTSSIRFKPIAFWWNCPITPTAFSCVSFPHFPTYCARTVRRNKNFHLLTTVIW